MSPKVPNQDTVLGGPVWHNQYVHTRYLRDKDCLSVGLAGNQHFQLLREYLQL